MPGVEIPKYHSGLIRAVRRTQEKVNEANLADSDEYDDDEVLITNSYYSNLSFSSDEELEYNPWADVTSPDYYSHESLEESDPEICETIAAKESDDEDIESDVEKATNPALYFAEVCTTETVATKPIANTGPLEYKKQKSLQNVLKEYADIVAASQVEIGHTTIIQHRIHTGNALPIAQKPYRMNPENTAFIKEELKLMEANEIIRPSTSPWASLVVVVGKKGREKHLCINFRKLNKVTKIDAYPLLRIDDLLDQLGGATWFSTLDLASGFWQISMHPKDVEKTAFITANGLYKFLAMPFGLNNAPGTFQRLMNFVLKDYLGLFVAVYLDNVIIYTKGSLTLHFDHLRQVFQTLRDACLKIKLKKYHSCFPSLSFLGHVVGRGGIQPDPEKINKEKNFPVPTNLRQLRGALGLLGYYRKFIKDFGRHAKSLTNLLKKDEPFLWTERQQNAFDRLKGCVNASTSFVIEKFAPKTNWFRTLWLYLDILQEQ